MKSVSLSFRASNPLPGRRGGKGRKRPPGYPFAAAFLTAPITETLFADGCTAPINAPVVANGGTSFAANTTLQFAVRSGFSSSASLVFPPSVRVTGNFAGGWTLTFDDGYGGAGEPDFNDLVVLIIATP